MDLANVLSINFRLGWPNPDLLPIKLLEDATKTALARPKVYASDGLLQYGPDEGDKELREKIARWMTDFYRPRKPVDVDRICISGGASQNLACVLQTYTDPGITRHIWCVAPAYFCACRLFDDHGFSGKLRAVPEDDEGIDISYLEQALEQSEEQASLGNFSAPSKTPRSWSKTYRHIIYAVPTFANPSGRIMSLARREALVRLARKYDACIVTDDVYDMLIWERKPLGVSKTWRTACQPRIVDVDAYIDGGPIDEFGNSVSQGSFSKTMGPGLRTGWAEATPKFAFGLSQTGLRRSGGSGSQFTAAIVAEMMDHEYLHTHLLPAYARRHQIVMHAIDRHLLPLGVTTNAPHGSGAVGGYYIWLDFPQTVRAETVKARAEEAGVLIHVGSLFMVEGDEAAHQQSFANGARICFVWEREDLLAKGIEMLADVIRRLQGRDSIRVISNEHEI